MRCHPCCNYYTTARICAIPGRQSPRRKREDAKIGESAKRTLTRRGEGGEERERGPNRMGEGSSFRPSTVLRFPFLSSFRFLRPFALKTFSLFRSHSRIHASLSKAHRNAGPASTSRRKSRSGSRSRSQAEG